MVSRTVGKNTAFGPNGKLQDTVFLLHHPSGVLSARAGVHFDRATALSHGVADNGINLDPKLGEAGLQVR